MHDEDDSADTFEFDDVVGGCTGAVALWRPRWSLTLLLFQVLVEVQGDAACVGRQQ